MVLRCAMGDQILCCGGPGAANAIILHGLALGHGRPKHLLRKPKCTRCYHFTWSRLGPWETKPYVVEAHMHQMLLFCMVLLRDMGDQTICCGSPSAPNAIFCMVLPEAMGDQRICGGSLSAPNAIILHGHALGHRRPNHILWKPECTKCYYFTWSRLGPWVT